MAMADASDPAHEASRAARDHWLEEGGVLVSTDYVLDETLTLLRVRLGLAAALLWWEQVDRSSGLRWEWIESERAERARAWFFQSADKTFSFADCASFVVMKELRLKRALTTDGHFRHAGFDVVP
jgi:hypothetical protein